MNTAITIYLIIGITLTFSELYHITESRTNLAKEPFFVKIVTLFFAIIIYPFIVIYNLIKRVNNHDKRILTKSRKVSLHIFRTGARWKDYASDYELVHDTNDSFIRFSNGNTFLRDNLGKDLELLFESKEFDSIFPTKEERDAAKRLYRVLRKDVSKSASMLTAEEIAKRIKDGSIKPIHDGSIINKEFDTYMEEQLKEQMINMNMKSEQ